MTRTARLALLLVLGFALAGCQWWARSPRPTGPTPAMEPLAPSPRLILGRIIAVDTARRLAFVDLAPDAPPAALVEGTELTARTADLRETGRLRTSRYVRGRTLGATIDQGQPQPGDEVVWLAP